MDTQVVQEELYYAKLTNQWYKAKYVILENGEAKLIKDILISEEEAQVKIKEQDLKAEEAKFNVFYK